MRFSSVWPSARWRSQSCRLHQRLLPTSWETIVSSWSARASDIERPALQASRPAPGSSAKRRPLTLPRRQFGGPSNLDSDRLGGDTWIVLSTIGECAADPEANAARQFEYCRAGSADARPAWPGHCDVGRSAELGACGSRTE